MTTHKRKVWARGLTPNEVGRFIETDGIRGVLRSVEHFDRGTVLSVQVEVDMPHDVEVVIHE